MITAMPHAPGMLYGLRSRDTIDAAALSLWTVLEPGRPFPPPCGPPDQSIRLHSTALTSYSNMRIHYERPSDGSICRPGAVWFTSSKAVTNYEHSQSPEHLSLRERFSTQA
jgi:hypothetical protein